MSDPTPAQEEFAKLVAHSGGNKEHPEDRELSSKEAAYEDDDKDEEDRFRASQIDAAMRTPALNNGPMGDLKLPPASFDSGRSTGVKGVIADARSYENARRSKWRERVSAVRHSMFGMDSLKRREAPSRGAESEGSNSGAEDQDEEEFLREWRESRRRELELETTRAAALRNRRTSPSVRMFGRFDKVDALGYLDAIEKVGRETIVVVFVYDHQCEVSTTIEAALKPLVTQYPTVHFVKVHYEDIEFDNAAVPAILAYRNQGDLFANLTGVIELIPDDEDFDKDSLERLFRKRGIV